MGILRQLFERFLRVLAQHVTRHASMGTPVLFTGAPGVVTAFFGYFFWLQKKSTSPAVREPQCPTNLPL